MNESNHYNRNYSFDHYDRSSSGGRVSGNGLIGGLKKRFRSPLFATAFLLISAVGFAALIVYSYPDSGSSTGEIPIVKAEVESYKSVPSDRQGMDVPYTQSTVFNVIDSRKAQHDRVIENLLAQQEPPEDPVRIGETIQNETVKSAAENDDNDIPSADGLAEVKSTPSSAQDSDSGTQPPETIHAAGSSPETLAFVRSVLDKKDSKTAQQSNTETAAAESVSRIEPGAGHTGVGSVLEPGSYYVQLGSVRTADGAEQEWKKFQKIYGSELNGAGYRVEKADLGERGTFYRIQAGPMSKSSASSVCGSIKARKPGGCLIVQ